MSSDLLGALAVVKASPDHRVLTRLERRASYGVVESPLYGLYLDTETTSLDTTTAKVVEFAAIRFEFSRVGQVGRIVEVYSGLEDPGQPLPAEVVALTGLTDEMVRGRKLDDADVTSIADGCTLVIAHNAGYDRPIVERRWPSVFNRLPWACSWRDVDWAQFGCACSKLAHLLSYACGEFFDAHRALDDCRVGLHVLAAAQLDGRSALSHLLESAGQETFRVWAHDAPYRMKDVLKARGYRWHDGSGGRAKAWYFDARDGDREAERAWLRANVGIEPWVDGITALNRYSVRSGT